MSSALVISACGLVAGVEEIAYQATPTPPDAAGAVAAPSDEGDSRTVVADVPPPEIVTDAGSRGEGRDAGASRPDAGTAIVDAGGPAPSPAMCTEGDFRANDRRDDKADRTVMFPAKGAPLYAPRCMRIRMGQMVTFAGDFGLFPLVPLEPTGGGGNPIPAVSHGGAWGVLFIQKGRFRYGSPGYPSMTGAVDVRYW